MRDPYLNDVQRGFGLFQEKQACKVFKTRSHSDILLILDKIVNMLKNMLYSHASRNVPVLRVLVVGPERYISFTLQYFVELFSKKSQDLPKHVQFLILPANTHFTMLRLELELANDYFGNVSCLDPAILHDL